MQTILGAGGAIGIELAKELSRYSDEIRLVSRNPKKINVGDRIFMADLTRNEEVDLAVKGSKVVYLVAGLPYKAKTWKTNWPLIMRNVIEACKKHKARLVFFDNVYMLDPEHLGNISEKTPIFPVSKKGKVRAEITEMLMSEIEQGNLHALIARAPDFIGLKNSMLIELGAMNFMKGKKAMWFGGIDCKHSFIYIPDAARATALLGNTEEAFDQIWNLPAIGNDMTTRNWLELIAKELNVKPKFMVLSTTLMTPMGLFVPIIKELKEMAYQFTKDYYFNSSKFIEYFNYKPVTPEYAVKEVVKALQSNTKE